MQNDSEFCEGCGAPAGETVRPTAFESHVPVLTLKPVFVPWAAMLAMIPLHVIVTVWGGGFLGGFSMFAARAVGLDIPGWASFAVFGVLFFVGIPIVTYTAREKLYARTEYRFFQNRLDYSEGLFTAEEKSVDYKNITDVNLIRGIVQKKHGLGTIVLSTPVNGTGAGLARSGIRVQDIPNTDQVYEQVKGLIRSVASAPVA
jgi:uncharacterized membrane protein YdbT with pleckstrin-like domain